MYQFLCVEANQAPPYLEVHWRSSSHGSFDEMEMDDMFYDDDAESSELYQSHEETVSGKSKLYGSREKSITGSRETKIKHNSHNRKATHSAQFIDDENDGLDIQSLSIGQAEFLYDRMEEDKQGRQLIQPPQQQISQPTIQTPTKRTINLDSFQIIKVIGKGKQIVVNYIFSLYFHIIF
jgi:hypothetical protein